MLKKLALIILTFISTSVWAEDNLRIGAIFSLSGFGAMGGKEELTALEMAKDEINEKGGIGGKKVELIVEDSRSDLKSTAAAFQKLAGVDRVPVVIGPNWAEFTEVVAPLADRYKLPTVSTSGWKKGLIPKHPYLYSLLPPHAVSAKPLAEAIERNKMHRIVVVVSQNSFYLSFTEAILGQTPNVEVVDRIEVLPNSTDFRTIVGKFKDKNPDAILVMLEESGGLLSFVRQYRELNIGYPILTGGLMYQPNQDELLPLLNGVISVEFTAVGTPEFKANYLKRYGVHASGSSARGFDVLYVVKQAIDNCGVTREKIQQCLPKTDLKGTSGHIRFSAGHETLDDSPLSIVLTVKEGKYHHVTSDLKPTMLWTP